MKNIKGDIFGGITAGIVALPLALAFGIQAFSGISDPAASSIGALAGLVGATMLGFFAALFGGTPSQISGPTGPMTVVTASLLAGAWNASGDFNTVLISMSLAGIFCGLFQILFGVLKIGKYIRYIPYPVLSGFMSGIGAIIILQQIYPLFGLKSPSRTVDMVLQLPGVVGNISIAALIFGICTVLIIVFFPKITKKVPATLVALIAVTVVFLLLPDYGVPVIGEIPSGFPLPVFLKEGISLEGLDWGTLITTAVVPGITLAGLGSIDTLLTSVVADNITRTRHNSNRELIGQGIGNAISGLFCGIAGAGATMRTVVNVRSGGRSRVSGMIHAAFLLAVLLGLGSLVKYIPLCVLAGILLTVGWGIIDFRGFKDLTKVPREDAFVLVAVFLLTVFVDLLTAVAIGVVISCVLLMKRTSDLAENSYSVGKASDTGWEDENLLPQEHLKAIGIVRLEGPLFFGSVTGFNNTVQEIPEGTKTVIFRMKNVSYIDQSGLYAIETAIKDLLASGATVYMTALGDPVRAKLESIGFIPHLIPEDHIFPDFKAFAHFAATELLSFANINKKVGYCVPTLAPQVGLEPTTP